MLVVHKALVDHCRVWLWNVLFPHKDVVLRFFFTLTQFPYESQVAESGTSECMMTVVHKVLHRRRHFGVLRGHTMDTSDRGLDAGQADCHFYFRLEEDIFGTEKKTAPLSWNTSELHQLNFIHSAGGRSCCRYVCVFCMRSCVQVYIYYIPASMCRVYMHTTHELKGHKAPSIVYRTVWLE